MATFLVVVNTVWAALKKVPPHVYGYGGAFLAGVLFGGCCL